MMLCNLSLAILSAREVFEEGYGVL